MANRDESVESEPDFGHLIAAPTSRGYMSQPTGYLQRMSAHAPAPRAPAHENFVRMDRRRSIFGNYASRSLIEDRARDATLTDDECSEPEDEDWDENVAIKEEDFDDEVLKKAVAKKKKGRPSKMRRRKKGPSSGKPNNTKAEEEGSPFDGPGQEFTFSWKIEPGIFGNKSINGKILDEKAQSNGTDERFTKKYLMLEGTPTYLLKEIERLQNAYVDNSEEVEEVVKNCSQWLRYSDGCDWLELSRLVETTKLNKRKNIEEVVLVEEFICIPLGKYNFGYSGWIRKERDGEFSQDERAGEEDQTALV